MESGFFGSLFDMDGNGRLDMVERTMDIMAFDEMIRKEKEKEGGMREKE